MNMAARAVVQSWKDRGAIPWHCQRCALVLGYILDGVFCSYHAHREVRIPVGGRAVQVCDRCGQESAYDPASGQILPS